MKRNNVYDTTDHRSGLLNHDYINLQNTAHSHNSGIAVCAALTEGIRQSTRDLLPRR